MYMNMFGKTVGGQYLLSSVYKQKEKELEDWLIAGSSSNCYIIKSIFKTFSSPFSCRQTAIQYPFAHEPS